MSAAINPCTFTTTQTYRANGALATMTLPQAADLASEKLTFGYTDVGDPSSMFSPLELYARNVTYNKLSQLIGIQHGADGKKVAQTFTISEDSGRLDAATAVPELKPEAVDYHYTYDEAGNVTAISDTPEGQPAEADNQCFRYDYLRRLETAWTPGTGNCTPDPAVASLSGPAPYWHSWTMDSIGNRQTETRHATTNTVFTYTMPTSGTGSVRPHTVTKVQASGAQAWTRNYTYDSAGNMAGRPAPSGAAQSLTFDREGKLTKITEGTQNTNFVYDHDGNRLVRQDPDGSKSLYLGATEVRFNKGTNAKTATRTYSYGPKVIATRTIQGLNWIIGDHHGTAQTAISASTLAVSKRRFLPYGQQRGSVGTWPSGMNKGFVGGTIDPSGLTHVGAREYDPELGRFISVDPLIDRTDPQQMHGYAYSNNSPATFTDPDGLKAYMDPEPPKLKVGGTSGAHATAIGLRVIRLKAKYPHALISSDPSDEGGPDLVCWNCVPNQVWVWEVKPRYTSGVDIGGSKAARDLKKHMADVRNDPLTQGKMVVRGEEFEQEDRGRNITRPRQEVLVESKGEGIELYTVSEYDNEKATRKYKKKSDAAIVLAEELNDEVNKERDLVIQGRGNYQRPPTAVQMESGQVTSGPEDVLVMTGIFFGIGLFFVAPATATSAAVGCLARSQSDYCKAA